MKTGTVIASDVGGNANQIFKSGDKVNEEQFPRGNWDALVAGGWINEDAPAASEEGPEEEPEEEESEEQEEAPVVESEETSATPTQGKKKRR